MVDPTALTDPGQSPRPASPAEVPTPTGDRPPPPADPMLAQVLDGKYRLDAVLARGGSGRIYVGRQLSLDRPVAIKVLRSDLEGDDEQRFEERFFREASMAGQLQHPHVVTVHDYGRAETGVLYIAMELLGGRSLKERMSEGPMPPDEALPIFEQIVRGLRHAHRAGLVHRDMKPGNVQLVPGEDGVAFAKILDFGLVRGGDGDAEITRDGYFVGTPHYAAPEQVRGVAVDARADLYAVGVMLYRALCGKLPFWSKDAMAIAVAHVQDPYPPMASRAPDVAVPEALEAIVRRCMEKAPPDRYPDASALLLDLRGARRFVAPHLPVSVESTLAGPTPALPAPSDSGPVDAASATPSRGRRLLVGGLVALGLATAGAGGLAWEAVGPGRPESVPLVDPAAAVAPVEIDEDAALLAQDGPVASDAAPRSVAVVVSSDPPGAEVLLDGSVLGITPLSRKISVQAGEAGHQRTLRLRLAGHQSAALVLDTSGEQAAGAVVLSPLAAAAPAAVAPAPVAAPAAAPVAAPAAPVAAPSAAAPSAAAPSAAAPSAAAPSPEAPPAAPAGGVVADGVVFTEAQARAALAFLNQSDKDSLLRAGVAARQANIVLEQRPFASLQAFADTPYIGEKTVEAVKRAVP